MARTIVYPSRLAGALETDRAGKPTDSYLEKLTKYVPAEVLGFFMPAAALVSENTALLIVCLVIGAAATPGYLWLTSQTQPAANRPRWFFYVLAVIAFLAWTASASEPVTNMLGLQQNVAGFILMAAVFVIPFADQLLTRATN